MNEQQSLEFVWQYGTEEIRLHVGQYAHGGRLYIGMDYREDGEWESFDDLTVNILHEQAKANEAYISDTFSEEKIAFIQKHKLGEVLNEVGRSGFCTYRKVAFDMDRLRELDPQGVERYLKAHSELQQGKKKQIPKDCAER